MTLSDMLWDRYGRISYDDLPEEVRIRASHSILDWFGCALAGSQQPLAKIMRAEFAAEQGPSRLIGSPLRTIPQLAALVNGATGHALDYDDSNNVGGFHTTAPILPAALAVCELEGRSGRDLVTAMVVGVETGGRVAAALGREHYHKGWHTTGSMGVFGATAAVSWLYGLDREQFGYAMGLAASQSSGLQANFGTMGKPFHAGMAAERGLVSARLGRRGYVTNPDAIQAPRGLIDAAGTGRMNQELFDEVDQQWLTSTALYKYHAACHGTHATIESMRTLLADVEPQDIRRVLVRVHPEITEICKVVVPTTGLEAKFSVRAAAALTIIGADTPNPATYTDARVDDAQLREWIGRIDVQPDEAVSRTGAIVQVLTEDGPREARFDIGIPEPDLALQERRLRAKFEMLAGPVIGDDVKPYADRLLDVASLGDVGELFG